MGKITDRCFDCGETYKKSNILWFTLYGVNELTGKHDYSNIYGRYCSDCAKKIVNEIDEVFLNHKCPVKKREE